MTIAAKVTEVTCMSIAVEGIELGMFKVVSEWEGFRKLESMDASKNTLIISSEKPGPIEKMVNDMMSNMFVTVEKTAERDIVIISASPDIILKLRPILDKQK